MSVSTSTGLLVLLVTVASLVIPFAYPVRRDIRSQPFVTVPTDGPPRKRRRIAATVLLIGLLFGLYVVLTRNPHVWVVIVAPAIIFVLLIEILPDHAIRDYVIPLGRRYLVFAAIATVLINTLALLHAATESEILVRRLGNLLAWRFGEHPNVFWYYVIGAGILNWAIVRILREWIVLRRGVSTSNARVRRTSKTDAADAER